MTPVKLCQFPQIFSPTALRAYLAEFISTFFFVFAAVGSAMSMSKMTPDVTLDPSCLLAAAIAQAFALFATVYIAASISGGHVNPAVTFAFVVGGHIGVITAVFYWTAQLLGSVMACLFLRLVTAGQNLPTTGIATEMTGFGGAVFEGVTTFALVYTVYAAVDPRRRAQGVIGPIAIGLVLGANILASGPFTGGSMNPARSFGPAIVSGNFKNQGVYWVGPLIGAGVAALLYEHVGFPSSESSLGTVDTLVV